MAGRRDGRGSGVRRHAPIAINHRNLPDLTPRIGGRKLGEGFRRRAARAHEVKSVRTVSGIDHGLSGDSANPGLRPRHQSAYAEIMGLDSDAKISRDGIARNDRISMTKRVMWTSSICSK